MKKLSLISIFAVLAACSSAPSYQVASSEQGVGYSESMLTENQYRVTYRGSRFDSQTQVRDFALLRAAELTMQKNYDWFEVISSDTDVELEERAEVSIADRGPTTTRSCGLLGCTTSYDPGYVGTSVDTRRVDSAYVSVIELSMGRGEPENSMKVYDAQKLADSIRSQQL